MIDLDQNIEGLSETIDSTTEFIQDLNETLAGFNEVFFKETGEQLLVKIGAAQKQLFGAGNIEEKLINKALDPSSSLQAFEIEFLKSLDGFRGTLQDKADELKSAFKLSFENTDKKSEEIADRVAMFNDLVDDQVMAVLAKTDEDIQKLAASVSEAFGFAGGGSGNFLFAFFIVAINAFHQSRFFEDKLQSCGEIFGGKNAGLDVAI